MRYPKIAVAIAVLSLLVGVRNVSGTDYAADEGGAQVIDFVFAVGFTFLFWYGVVLLIGWVAGKVRRSP